MNQRKNDIFCIIAILTSVATLCISSSASPFPKQSRNKTQAVAPAGIHETMRSGVQQIAGSKEHPARAARYVNIKMTDEEMTELASIVFLEAGNQSMEGQQAVVEVIFNRVLHPEFPNTVHDVLHQGENSGIPQFSTIYAIHTASPVQEQYDAIYGALYGDTILDADVVFFSQSGENSRVWGRIGNHTFCREYVWGTTSSGQEGI